MTSAAFDTDYHVDLAKAIPALKDDLFRGDVAQTVDEGVIHAGEWDSDAFSKDFTELIELVNIIKPIIRRNVYGLQTASSAHFDNSNIRGATEVARKRYENGLSNLLATNVEPILNNKPGNDDLSGRGFSGAYAGVQNLLYRFGQVLHSYQDFYSHSNWVEMSKVDNGKWQLKDKLLDSSYGLPRIISQGDFIPGTNVMIAVEQQSEGGLITNAEGEDLGRFKAQGYGAFGFNPFQKKIPVFWLVASEGDYGRQKNELYTFTSTNRIVGGIASGGVGPLAYSDPDLNVRMRDDRKTGVFESEYFSGFGHGGIAQDGVGQRVKNLNKDKPGNSLYNDAMDFARKQTIHEFDRMSYLIYEQYGLPGLQHFAEYALKSDDIPAFLQKYSAPAPSSYSPAEASNQLVHSHGSALIVDESDHGGSALDSDILLRKLIAFDGDTTDSGDITKYLIDQAKVSNDQGWFDVVSLHGAHDDLDLTPATVSHLDLGLRGYWAEGSSAENTDRRRYIQDDALTYYVELKNRDVTVYLDNFRVGRDTIALVGGRGDRIASFNEITYDNYAKLKSKLFSRYNVVLDAVPFVEQQSPSVVIKSDSPSSPINANGEFLIRADQFYGDLDDSLSWGQSGNDDTLRFSDYDQSLVWLRLDDLSGNLVVDTRHPDYPSSGSFGIVVRLSDGVNQLDEQELKIELNPSVSLGSGFQFDSDLSFKATPLFKTSSAYQVLYGFDEPDFGEEFLYPLFTSQGALDGVESKFDYLSNLTLSDDAHSGELIFYGRDLADDSSEQLSWRLVDNSRVILSDQSGDLFALDPITNTTATAGASGQGFNAPASSLLPVGYGLADSLTALDLSDKTSYELSYTIQSDLKKKAKIGYMLMDSVTGSVYDPRQNDFIDQPSDLKGLLLENGRIDVKRFQKAVSLHDRSVQPNSTLTTSFRFDLETPMLQDRLRVVPFVRYNKDDFGFVSSGFDASRGQISGVVASPNSVGFERKPGAKSSDSDYSDIFLTINDLHQLV